MSLSETQGGRRAELYVRSLLPAGSRAQQTAVLERLGALEADGIVDEYDVHVWGREAPASPSETRTDAGAYALDRVSRFREWAQANGVSMASTFERREVDAEFTDETYRSLRFPTFLLAEYRDDELTCVTPHRTDETVFTVADRLGRLARDEAVSYEPLARARPTGPPPSHIGSDREPVASE